MIYCGAQTGQLLKESDKESGHQKTISSLCMSTDKSHFLTGSGDKSAKVRILCCMGTDTLYFGYMIRCMYLYFYWYLIYSMKCNFKIWVIWIIFINIKTYQLNLRASKRKKIKDITKFKKTADVVRNLQKTLVKIYTRRKKTEKKFTRLQDWREKGEPIPTKGNCSIKWSGLICVWSHWCLLLS